MAAGALQAGCTLASAARLYHTGRNRSDDDARPVWKSFSCLREASRGRVGDGSCRTEEAESRVGI